MSAEGQKETSNVVGMQRRGHGEVVSYRAVHRAAGGMGLGLPVTPPLARPLRPTLTLQTPKAGLPQHLNGCSPSAQVGPLQPDGQWHSKPEGTSWQEPPLAHGLEVQACSATLGTRGGGLEGESPGPPNFP